MSDAAALGWPSVTIMIPTYGQESMVMQAIDSALMQDYPNLEVLVIDDCSPDATARRVAQRHDPRLRYHRNAHNLGRVANYRHALYDLASGDWVVNLDGDDYYTDAQFIRGAMSVARQHPDVVMVTARCTTDAVASLEENPAAPTTTIEDGIQVVMRLPAPEYHLMHMATVYRRDEALRTDFYRDEAISADWECLYRLALRGRVVRLERTVGVWRIHGANLSSTTHWKPLAHNLEIWRAIFADASRLGVDRSQAQDAYLRTLFYFSKVHLYSATQSPDRMNALRYLLAVRRLGAGAFVKLALHPRSAAKILLSTAGWRIRRSG